MIAGSPIEDGSGFIRRRQALATLVRNTWVEIEETVSELRIRRRTSQAAEGGDPT
jgi:hypothetical protein